MPQQVLGLTRHLHKQAKPSSEPPSDAPTGPQPLRPSLMVGELHGRPDRRQPRAKVVGSAPSSTG